MRRCIIIQFTTLDGIVEDPDGSDGTVQGGWAMRHGPAAIAGDKFRLGTLLEHGTLLFGRRTWEHFSTLWPTRQDPFSAAMNAARKIVVTHRPVPTEQWSNSTAITAPLLRWVPESLASTDLVVIGSRSVVAELMDHDLVDEYRLLVFPTALGAGHRLFPQPRRLRQVGSEQVGPGTLVTLVPDAGGEDTPERA